MRTLMLIVVMIAGTSTLSLAQSMKKKYKTFTVSRVLPFSSEKVWAAVAEDYGNIANSHPKIVASNYLPGSLKGGKNAKRMCYFNDKQTRMLKEEIVEWNPEKGYFVNRVLEARKFPVNTDNTRATYSVKSLGANKSEVSMKMEFRTKPAFMGAMAQGQFKKLLNDYLLAVEHHIATGESVTAANFKEVKRQYDD